MATWAQVLEEGGFFWRQWSRLTVNRAPLGAHPCAAEVTPCRPQLEAREAARDEERNVVCPLEVLVDGRQASVALDRVLRQHVLQIRQVKKVGLDARGEVDVVKVRHGVHGGRRLDGPRAPVRVKGCAADARVAAQLDAAGGHVVFEFLVVRRRDAAAVACRTDVLEALGVRVGAPEVGLLDVAELAHPREVDVEELDLARTAHEVPHLCDAAADGKVGELGGRETAANDEDIGRLAGSYAVLDHGSRELLDLHGVADVGWLESLVGTKAAESSNVGDDRLVGRADGKDDSSSVMCSLV
ncbi:hypothetical protein HYQ46_010703 [Verticillium longisporum]|nr:hypothetical protein HYQ46_010703 [Verticillium longisporum]